jgi:hypothetical protein
MTMEFPERWLNVEAYINRKTLIVGAVNSGKTRLTTAILDGLCAAGWRRRIVVLDWAPELTTGIGGKIDPRPYDQVRWLTCDIIPPRLRGRDPEEIQALAERNAQAIAPLLDSALAARRAILIVNDASLYLQTGNPRRLMEVAAAYPTVIMNAYYGHSFVAAPFTDLERRRVENLTRWCDRVLRLTAQVTEKREK